MPIKTIVACTLGGAAAGAAVASAYISTSKRESPTTTIPVQASTTSPPPPATVQHAALVKAAAAGLPVDPAGLFQYGFPGPVADTRHAPSLVSSFNRMTRNPHWVAEHITPESLAQNRGDRKHSEFIEDASIPPVFRAKLADYRRSGYDRGHQVPAADAKWSQDAMNATFALSNMCPQVGDGFNRDYWAHFEDFCRRLTGRYPSVRIVTGPLYLPTKGADGKYRVTYEVIGNPPNVAVPTHFYKVIYAEDGKVGGNVSLGAFVLPNAEIDNSRSLKTFEVPLSIVERASGLEFASKLAPGRRRSLCQEVECDVIIKNYKERQDAFFKENRSKESIS